MESDNDKKGMVYLTLSAKLSNGYDVEDLRLPIPLSPYWNQDDQIDYVVGIGNALANLAEACRLAQIEISKELGENN